MHSQHPGVQRIVAEVEKKWQKEKKKKNGKKKSFTSIRNQVLKKRNIHPESPAAIKIFSELGRRGAEAKKVVYLSDVAVQGAVQGVEEKKTGPQQRSLFPDFKPEKKLPKQPSVTESPAAILISQRLRA